MAGFSEALVLVEGAVSDHLVLDDESWTMFEHPARPFDRFLAQLEREAKKMGFTAEVYVLRHDHPFPTEGDDEDVCAQYVTHHQAAYTFGEEADVI